jgi:hypothetical protein
MTGSGGLPAPDELRQLVREILREVLPAGGTVPDSRPGDTVSAVRLSTDRELHEFVREVLRLAEDPQWRQDLLAGRFRFTLDPAASANGNGHGVTPVIHRVEKGAVTERAVIAAAKAGHRLVLGPRAVLTPLARDKARALGVPVEKER